VARAAGPVDEDEDEDDVDVAPPSRTPRASAFGSVWDSQIGTPAASTAPRAPITDDEDFDEPEIPEYLIAEQRRGSNNRGGGGGGGRGARGGRSAYQSAMERERYGRGGGGGGGINRYPDVSGRPRSSTPPRDDRNYSRGDRPVTSAPPPRSSSEPWSDVPPELEAMLRAQVAQKPAPSRPSAGSSNPAAEDLAAPVAIDEEPITKPRATRKPRATAATTAVETSAGDEAAPAKPRATRKPAASRTSASKAAAATAVDGDGDLPDASAAPTAAAKPRATRKPKAAADAVTPADTTATDAPPKRRAPRKTAATDPA